MKQSKRILALKRRNAHIATMAKTMQKHGASEHTIRKALPGLQEFAPFLEKELSDPASPQPPSPQPDPPADPEAPGVFLSQVEPQPVHWLWPNRIPLGKITLLDGDPGMGKSLLALDLAARVSCGLPMPDGTPGPQGGVIIIAPEDDPADTLRPRLEAAGGYPSRVLLLTLVPGLDAHQMQLVDRPFSLSQDLELLEKAIERTKARLVILDPLMAVLGGNMDSSRDQQIREVFTPLAQIAQRSDCAILIIRHLTKGASHNALYRGAGSISIIAAARTGLLVASDPCDETRRILATTKNNLSLRPPNLTYQIQANAAGIPSLRWLGENHQPVSSLLQSPPTLSLERQQILEALRAADAPLSPLEVAQRTDQPEPLVRRTLSRMYEAREVARPSRGHYTALAHPSLLQRSTAVHTTNPSDSSDSIDLLDSSDSSDRLDPIDRLDSSDSSDPLDPSDPIDRLDSSDSLDLTDLLDSSDRLDSSDPLDSSDSLDRLDPSDLTDLLDSSDPSDPNLANFTTHNHHSLPAHRFNESETHVETLDHAMGLAT